MADRTLYVTMSTAIGFKSTSAKPRCAVVFSHVLSAEASFAQSTVCCLPAPIYSSELAAFLEQDGPNPLEDPVATPSLEPAMDRAIVAEMHRKFVPLTSRSEAEDGAVDGRSPVDSRATTMSLGRCRSILPKDRRKDSANLADTERNERQAFKRQQFSAAKSEMAYHNHFVLNSLGGNPKSAMPFPLRYACPHRSRSVVGWQVPVHGADVPGGFIIIDGRFVEFEPNV